MRTTSTRPPGLGGCPPAPPARKDRDACGIGLVADASGQASRALLDAALTGLACVRHRGAIAADGISGDGAGLLVPIPAAFTARLAAEMGSPGEPSGRLGLVMAYLDRDDSAARRAAEVAVGQACADEGIDMLGWRDVPVDESELGDQARRSAPSFRQAVIRVAADVDVAEAERRCYRARRRAR
jgi:glutamate synthase domain-containing protein 1